jgi:hypothetical protein
MTRGVVFSGEGGGVRAGVPKIPAVGAFFRDIGDKAPRQPNFAASARSTTLPTQQNHRRRHPAAGTVRSVQ